MSSVRFTDEPNKTEGAERIDQQTYEQLDGEFQKLLTDIGGDETLQTFSRDFSQLLQVLRKSYTNHDALAGKCQQLKSDLTANWTKVPYAKQLGSDEDEYSAAIKQDVLDMYNKVDVAHTKEQQARATVAQLQADIDDLKIKLENECVKPDGSQQRVDDLLTERERLSKELNENLNDITKLRETVHDCETKTTKLQNDGEDIANKIVEMTQDLQERRGEVEQEKHRKEMIERDSQDSKDLQDAKRSEIEEIERKIGVYVQNVSHLESEMRIGRVYHEKTTKNLDVLSARFSKLQTEYESQLVTEESTASENAQKVAQLKEQENEILEMKKECTRLGAIHDAVLGKIKEVEDKKLDIEGKKERLKLKTQGMEIEYDMRLKKVEEDRTKVLELTNERDKMKRDLIKGGESKDKVTSLLKVLVTNQKNLERDKDKLKVTATSWRDIIHKQEKERDDFMAKSTKRKQQLLDHMDKSKAKDLRIFELRKEQLVLETRLKQQMNLYEAVRNDRNLFSKKLMEIKEEVLDMTRGMKVSKTQSDQLRAELQRLNTNHHEEQKEQEHVDHLNLDLKLQCREAQARIEDNKAVVGVQANEESKLLKILGDAEIERIKQKKELEKVVSERDILGNQLVRRDDELKNLYERSKLQQSVLNQGEKQYNECAKEIDILKQDLEGGGSMKLFLKKRLRDINDNRREVSKLREDLMRKRFQCTALEEQLEIPINIHRWRRLEGSDQNAYEMVVKIISLRDKLVSKTGDLADKEALIQEKERLYIEMKQTIARQPGVEVGEQLQVYEQALKDKNAQVKGMDNELSTIYMQISDYKKDLVKLSKELIDVKKKYFIYKKSEGMKEGEEKPLSRSQRRRSARRTQSGTKTPKNNENIDPKGE